MLPRPASPSRAALSALLPMLAGRLGSALLTLFLVSVVIFTVSGLLPGDAAQETLGPKRNAGTGRRAAPRDGPRSPGADPLHRVAWRHCAGRSRPVAGRQYAGARDHRRAAAQYADARRAHRAAVGAAGAADRHMPRPSAGAAARPRAQHRHTVDGRRARISGRDAGRAGVFGQAAVAAVDCAGLRRGELGRHAEIAARCRSCR